MKFFSILFASLLFFGCATAPKTSSGHPEIIISAPKAKVRAAALNAFINDGYVLTNEGESLLVLQKEAGMGVSIFLGTLAHPNVFYKIRLTMIDLPTGTRVVASITFDNRGRGELGENTGSYSALQYKLECIKSDLEGTARPANPPAPPPAASPRGASPRGAAR